MRPSRSSRKWQAARTGSKSAQASPLTMSLSLVSEGGPLRWRFGRPIRLSGSSDLSAWRASIGCCRLRTIGWWLTKNSSRDCHFRLTAGFRQWSLCRGSLVTRSRWWPSILWIFRLLRNKMPQHEDEWQAHAKRSTMSCNWKGAHSESFCSRQQRRSGPQGAEKETPTRGSVPRNQAPESLWKAVRTNSAKEGWGNSQGKKGRAQARGTRGSNFKSANKAGYYGTPVSQVVASSYCLQFQVADREEI